MRHRGPDSEGCDDLTRPPLTLEHCRLAIIDPENREADQPFTDPTGRWTIVYNGELFNFREIRARLKRRGCTFHTDSDTEVVLQSFIADGERAFSEFRGMFAFLIADRETGTVVAARDHVGVKPLYWWHSDGLFVAGSELRTVLAHPAVTTRLDERGVVEYLAFGRALGERTLIEGVNKLRPGHGLRVSEAGTEVFEFWDPLPVNGRVEDEALEEQVMAQLDSAVAASMVSDVPVSLMLSGGLDSSAIAVLAARHVNPSDLTAYSVSFGLPDDESGAAARLAGDLGIRHREISLTREVVAEELDLWLKRLDVPSANPTWIAVSHIARAVREDGGKVLLSGDGGDELFGGYNRWMKYLQMHRALWGPAPRGLRKLGGGMAKPFARGLAGDIARRARDGQDLFVGSRPFHDDDLAACLGPRGQRAAATTPPESWVVGLRRQFDERAPDPGDYLSWMSYLSLKTSLLEDFLVRLDTMGMAESVEGRVPLLDPNLVRWSFLVPQARKVPRLEQKALFRSAVAPMLPDYVTSRPKQGFCPPVADWASSLIAPRMNGDSLLVEEGLLSPDAAPYLREKGGTKASFALWSLGTLSAWCEQNL